ncbi:hypothetical protein JTB14_028823 [Gonioctena quinquepunctata]|nr:hypothetical protein JTB14_028823 [Gonioctena quinquepunctata]
MTFFCYFRCLAAILEKGLTVQEAIDIAFGEDDEMNGCIEAVNIAPPDPATLTDEDSRDEDEGGNVDNLSRRQLRADAGVRTALGTTLEEDITSDESQSQESDVLFEDSVSSINDVNVSPAHTYIRKFLITGIGFQEISPITKKHFLKQIFHRFKTNRLLTSLRCS